MLKYLVEKYIRDEKSLDSVVKLIAEFFSTDVFIGNKKINVLRGEPERLGELEVLKELEKGTFNGAQ